MTKQFYQLDITGNTLDDYKTKIQEFREEILSVNPRVWINWPEKDLYEKDMIWKVIPICFCLPSDDEKNIKWLGVDKFLPQIVNFVKNIKGVRTAIISKLGKNTKIIYHQGWAPIANHVLRCHFPLIVEEHKSGVVVEEHTQYHKVGDYILFDDSLMHYGFNYSDDERYVLIVDIARPDNIAKGSSTIEASDELVKLSNIYKIINNIYKAL